MISYSYKADGGTNYIEGLPTDAGGYTIKARVATSKEEGYRAADSSNTFSLTIEKAPRKIEALTVLEQTDVSITLNPPVLSGGGDDGTIEYACSADGSVSTGGWQISPVISGLNRNTTYYLFARVTGGRNYKDTISEIGTEWKTDKTKVAKPSLKKMKYAYTGEAVAVELNDFDSGIMGITGNTGVDAGAYQVRITMDSEDFMWSDGTCSPIVLEWKIMLRRELPAPEAEEEGITDHSITLKTAVPVPPESAKDGILEYGYALEDDSEKVENWQTSTAF